MSTNYYQATSCAKADNIYFPTLADSVQVDVCVIGGGMSGLATAQELCQRKYSVAVLEAKNIGYGASGRNGGQAIVDVGCGYEKLSSLIGVDLATKIFHTTREGINIIRKNINTYNIACDSIEGTLTVSQKPRQDKELGKISQLYKKLGYEVELWDREETQSVVGTKLYTGAIYDPKGLHFHPLNYTLGLAKGLKKDGVLIYENTQALKFNETSSGVEIITSSGSIIARKIVLCANVFNELSDHLSSYIMPVGTYIAATKPLGDKFAKKLIANQAAICDINFVLDYFRIDSSTRLLFGGRVSYTGSEPKSLKRSLFQRMVRVYPEFKQYSPEEIFEYSWGGHVDITMNRAPHFGSLGDRIFFLQGFSGHGVALTNVAGRVIAEAITGDRRRLSWFETIPHRRFFGGKVLRTPLLAAAMLYYRVKDYF